MSSLGHITRCRGEVREALLIISILPFLKFAIRKLNKSSSPRQAICTINTVSFFLRLFILISYLPNNWPQNTSNTSRKSCAAVNNKGSPPSSHPCRFAKFTPLLIEPCCRPPQFAKFTRLLMRIRLCRKSLLMT